MLRLVQSAAGTKQLLGSGSQNIPEILFRRNENGKLLGYSWKFVALAFIVFFRSEISGIFD